MNLIEKMLHDRIRVRENARKKLTKEIYALRRALAALEETVPRRKPRGRPVKKR